MGCGSRLTFLLKWAFRHMRIEQLESNSRIRGAKISIAVSAEEALMAVRGSLKDQNRAGKPAWRQIAQLGTLRKFYASSLLGQSKSHGDASWRTFSGLPRHLEA
jgi:hypothetical protein